MPARAHAPPRPRRAALRRLLRLGVAAAAAPLLALRALPAGAQDRADEVAVKAAYLVRFLPFVEWPASAGASPLVIGVLAHDALARQVEAIIPGRRVAGRELQLRRLQPGDAADDVDVLFLGQPLRPPRLAEVLKNRPVLVVSDKGLADGAMLGFVIVDGRVGFEASPAAAAQAGLKLGARLLAVAERVQR